MAYRIQIELQQEDDGRWIADVVDWPGVMCYSATREEAIRNVEALALRVIADKVESGQVVDPDLTFACA